MHVNNGPQKVLWVTGAPRSGTHLITSLICTSSRTNPFMPEFHTLNNSMAAWHRSRAAWTSQKHLFLNREELDSVYRSHILDLVGCAWRSGNRPSTLVLKHCSITPIIPFLLETFPEWTFAVCIRDARDVIASEVRGWTKLNGSFPPIEVIDQLIEQYNWYYLPLMEPVPVIGPRVQGLIYEDIARGEMDSIERVTGEPANADALWESEKFSIGVEYEGTAAFSRFWGEALTASRIGSYLETLDEDIAERIATKTGEVAARFKLLIQNYARFRDDSCTPAV